MTWDYNTYAHKRYHWHRAYKHEVHQQLYHLQQHRHHQPHLHYQHCAQHQQHLYSCYHPHYESMFIIVILIIINISTSSLLQCSWKSCWPYFLILCFSEASLISKSLFVNKAISSSAMMMMVSCLTSPLCTLLRIPKINEDNGWIRLTLTVASTRISTWRSARTRWTQSVISS